MAVGDSSLMCSSSEIRAPFDWQDAPTVMLEAPTVRHKKARTGRARDALTLNKSIVSKDLAILQTLRDGE